jgi:predicted permease
MLAFWGFMSKKIDFGIVKIPLLYLCITFLAFIISLFVAKKLFKDKKEISIVSLASVTGITGSIGIPLGITLFSQDTVIYTTFINTVSMIFVYTVGVYIYSRGSYGILKSFKNVFKMPIIWASFIAVTLNILNISINPSISKALQMGAYASIVLQLVIFGIFLQQSKISELNSKIAFSVLSLKFVMIPLLALLVLHFFKLKPIELNSLFLELIVPLAITNISLASLFDCKPKTVTSLVFISSIIFVPYAIVLISLLH